MKRRGVVVSLVLVCFLGGEGSFDIASPKEPPADYKLSRRTAWALTDKYQQNQLRSLRGLEGIGVVIETLQSDAELIGLTKSQLQTDIESQLGNARIRVLTEEERLKTKGTPYLYVNVNSVLFRQISSYGYNIYVALQQDVRSERNPSADVLSACTWIYGITGGVETSKLVEEIRKDVGALVDRFINDYLTVNPVTSAK